LSNSRCFGKGGARRRPVGRLSLRRGVENRFTTAFIFSDVTFSKELKIFLRSDDLNLKPET
jgi:hypothetical protein